MTATPRILILVVAAVSLVGAGALLNRSISSRTATPAPAPTLIISPSPSQPAASITVPTLAPKPDSLLYSSARLGISFYYAASSQNQSFSVRESGSKVFVYPANTPPESGQFVEVFSKDEDDSLAQAISQRFLSGISSQKCQVVETVDGNGLSRAEISYPSPTEPEGSMPRWDYGLECPADYKQTNGIRYFTYDPRNPGVFAFVSIGQYSIPSGSTTQQGWQDTLTFSVSTQ